MNTPDESAPDSSPSELVLFDFSSPSPWRYWLRRVWSVMAVLLGSVGGTVAVLNLSGAELVVTGIAGVPIAAAVIHVAQLRTARPAGWPAWVVIGSAAAAFCLVVVGWFLLVQMSVVVLVALVAVAHPDLAWWASLPLRRLILSDENRSAEGMCPSEPVEAGALSDDQLCRNWRLSYWALERALKQSDHDCSLQLIALRQSYLDEMERRHTETFARWLQNGARPAGDPTRFFAADGPA